MVEIRVDVYNNYNDFYFQLKRFIASYLNNNSNEIVIIKDENGKPILLNNHEKKISISHSKKIYAYGISNNNFGIDIECIRSMGDSIERICEFFFHQEEIKYIFENPHNKDLRFLEVWTAKEAYSKFKGTGLTVNSKNINVLKKSKLITISTNEFVLSIYTRY
jgi:phosphopantetheinyl transferase